MRITKNDFQAAATGFGSPKPAPLEKRKSSDGEGEWRREGNEALREGGDKRLRPPAPEHLLRNAEPLGGDSRGARASPLQATAGDGAGASSRLAGGGRGRRLLALRKATGGVCSEPGGADWGCPRPCSGSFCLPGTGRWGWAELGNPVARGEPFAIQFPPRAGGICKGAPRPTPLLSPLRGGRLGWRVGAMPTLLN